MEIYSELKQNPNLSVALGFFDGVHLGHKAVIENAVNFARKQGEKSAVITFKDHPCRYFYDLKPEYILTRDERRHRIEALGVDYMFELDFSLFANLWAEEYLKDVLVKNFSPIAISTGFNHNFGKLKQGNTEFLQKYSREFRYRYFLTPPQQIGDEIISSTAIRSTLIEGDIEKANAMLGYNFGVSGVVVKGKHLGRAIGFPTANIIYPNELIRLPLGVYATKVCLGTKVYFGVTNFGKCPTVSDCDTACVETNILNFEEDIYGKILRVEFLHYIRPEKKFSDVEELKSQIGRDLLIANSYHKI